MRVLHPAIQRILCLGCVFLLGGWAAGFAAAENQPATKRAESKRAESKRAVLKRPAVKGAVPNRAALKQTGAKVVVEAEEETTKRQVQVVQQAQQVRIVRRGGFSTAGIAVRKTADANDPVEHILILTPRGPFLAELKIFVDGQPFRQLREKLVEEAFQQADTNKDGKRTWKELLMSPRASFGVFRYVASNPATLNSYLRRYDVNGDGLADRYEIRRQIAQTGGGAAFNVRPVSSSRPQPDIKTLLDTDKDGKLSPAELAAAPERLKSRDANDNDLLELNELTGNPRSRFAGRGVRLSSRPRNVFLLGPTADLTAIATAFKKQYGVKGEVRAAAFRIDPALFRKIDLNKNGRLDDGELVGLHLAEPRLKLVIHLGAQAKPRAGIVISAVPNGVTAMPPPGKMPVESCSLSLPGWKMSLTVKAAQFSQYTTSYARMSKMYLSRYDVDKNGYIDKKDIAQLGTHRQFVEHQMKVWDLNNDGKVFEKEIMAAYQKGILPLLSQVTLSVYSTGPSLFGVLDTSGDNRLSLREMRTAGQRLQSLDRNKNGYLDAEDIPSETVLNFFQGRSYYYANRVNGTSGSGRTAPARGPKWFIHMDKNGDGDVTRKEFLGTREQFERLDTNRDGFIEPKEAEAASRK